MDLSKLPRLSNTPSSPPALEIPPSTAAPAIEPGRRGAFCDQCGAALRAGAKFCDSCGRPITPGAAPRNSPPPEYRGGDPGGGVAMDVWFSLIIGLIFLFLGSNYAKYKATVIGGGTWHTGIVWSEGTPKSGQEVTLDELEPEKRAAFDQQMMSEAALFLFGIGLIVDAAVRLAAWLGLPGRRLLLGFGMLVTVFAVAYNLLVVAKLMKAGVTPLYSLLCVAFGGFILFAQWSTLRMTLVARTPTSA